MGSYTPSPAATQVTNDYRLLRYQMPIFDLDTLHFDFAVEGCLVTGMYLRHVGAAIDRRDIDLFVDPALPAAGMTDEVGGRIRLLFAEDHADDLTLEGQGVILHEAAHAIFRSRKLHPLPLVDEATAFLTQAAFFIAKGESLFETWKTANADLINQPWMDENSYEPLAYVYQTADAIARQHRLTTRCVRLAKSNVATLMERITKVAAYSHLGRAQPAQPDHGRTRRSRRWRRRRR